jgi:L-ascorbate metabolism protein UlaG (beta-lactamase superfamily)
MAAAMAGDAANPDAAGTPKIGDALRIQWVGHATVQLDMAGVRILTDPVLRPRLMHLRRRGKVDTHALRGVDAVLISHLHYDHLDFPSLQRIGRSMPIVVPRGAGRLIRRKGRFEHVLEVAPGESLTIGSLSIRVTPAEHPRGRLPFGVEADPVGYVVEGPHSAYFAGDTDLFPAMSDIGPVDVALVPIWGWGKGLGPGHMDPRRAAESLGLLRPTLAVPIHWGTYYPAHAGIPRPPHFVDTPPLEFSTHASELAPEVEVRVLQPGESTVVGG